MLIKKLIIFVGFGVLSACTSMTQPVSNDITGEQLRYETISIHSKILDEDRQLLVRTPKGYEMATDQKYPILFVLNRNENFVLASRTVEFLSNKRHIPEMIVVGIPKPDGAGDYSFVTDEHGDVFANKFLEFLENELFIFVDQNYRAEPSRILAGHSLAGLFASHAFLKHTDSFNAFIVMSPSFHRNDSIIDQTRDFLSSQSNSSNRTIYFGIGDDEYYPIREEYDRMRLIFEANAPNTLRWTFSAAPNTSHRTMPMAGLYDGITTTFQGYNFPVPLFRKLGCDGMIKHYDRMSAELGYKIRPPKRDITGLLSFMSSPRRSTEKSHSTKASKYRDNAQCVLDHYYPE